MKILSIDDSKSVHAFINVCLEGTDHSIEHAYNGEDGLKILKENPRRFDLVLLDWEMPGLTGPEVLVELMKLPIKFPVVMVTTKNNMEDISRVLGIGAREYIMKPFTREILLEKIESLF